jgi:hypothetical protein
MKVEFEGGRSISINVLHCLENFFVRSLFSSLKSSQAMAPPKRGLKIDLGGGSNPNLSLQVGQGENTGTVHNVGAAGLGLIGDMETNNSEITGTMVRVGEGEGNNSIADFQERIRSIGSGVSTINVGPEDLETVAELGSGNGGTVYLARHRGLGKIMAHKVSTIR